jgi:dUTPase
MKVSDGIVKTVSTMPSILYIVPAGESRAVYEAAAAAYNARPYEERDAGFDLFSRAISIVQSTNPTDCMTVRAASRIQQQISAAYYDTERRLFRAFWLLPRSSISRTPLRMANSVGLIDAGYRGPIMAVCDGSYNVSANERLFQLAAPDLLPWGEIRVVSEIPGGPTVRGTGGFGSTGVTGTATHAGPTARATTDLSGARASAIGTSDAW